MTTSVPNYPATGIPEPVARVASVMAGYQDPWALCGGWAVDAWLGRETREHGDVDIIVFQDGLRALRDHLVGWQLVAHDTTVDGGTGAAWTGRPLSLPAHIHGRLPVAGEALPERVDNAAGQGFGLDIQINERSGGEWVLSREPSISRALSGCVQPSPWGVPAVTPEVVLFYKASGERIRLRDTLDFAALRPNLGGAQRAWLREAISLLGHPWLAQLSP